MNGPRQGRPKMKDVAELAGVSVSTVSYVINDSGPVAPAPRARVLAAVEELGYAPNASARSLKRQNVSTIGLIVPDLGNGFFALVAEGVAAAALEHDVLVVLGATDATEEREAYYTHLLRSQRLDGVVYLSGSGVPPRALLELAEARSVVFVDERLMGVDVPFVGADNRRGAREAMEHVLGLGHERIAIVAGPTAMWTSEQRLAGYREALAAAGHDPDAAQVVSGDYREGSGREAAAELLDGVADPPTAIVCSNDLMAMGVIDACRERGLEVPRDMSVVGFDDVPLAAYLAPPLTTVRQPAGDMGRRAAETLLKQIGASQDEVDDDLLPTELRVRASTAPPRQ